LPGCWARQSARSNWLPSTSCPAKFGAGPRGALRVCQAWKAANSATKTSASSAQRRQRGAFLDDQRVCRNVVDAGGQRGVE
jgi:hypothetical protein